MNRGWRTKPLGELLTVQNGYAFDSAGFNLFEGLPLIRIRDLRGSRETEVRFGGDFDHRYLVQPGEFLIGMDGEFRCYEWKGSPALLNQRVCRLTGFAEELHPRFLFYGINEHLREIEDVTGFTTVKHLSSKKILTISFAFPSLSEQRRIVSILDKAFEGIATAKANAEKNLQNTRALFESHLESTFSQVRQGWKESPIRALCIIGDGNHSSNYPKKQDLVFEGVPFIRATNLVSGRISGKEMRFLSSQKHAQLKKGHLKTGDILFTNRGEIGKTAMVDSNYNNANLNSQIAWLRCNEGLNNRFLFHCLNSTKIKAHLQLSKSGTALQQFTIGQLRELPIPVPPENEQIALAAVIDALLQKTDCLESICQRKLTALDALKKSLLHLAFCGKL